MFRRNKIQQWIAEGEGPTLDFKKNITSAPKIARSIVAFANSRGGKIVVGVEDTGRIVGIDLAEEQYQLETAAKQYCYPTIELELEPYESNGKTLLIAHVPESTRKPHYALDLKGINKIYVRIADKCVEPTTLIEQVLISGDLNNLQRQNSAYNQVKNELAAYLQQKKQVSIADYAQLKKCTERSARRTLIDLLFEGFLSPIDEQTFAVGKIQ